MCSLTVCNFFPFTWALFLLQLNGNFCGCWTLDAVECNRKFIFNRKFSVLSKTKRFRGSYNVVSMIRFFPFPFLLIHYDYEAFFPVRFHWDQIQKHNGLEFRNRGKWITNDCSRFKFDFQYTSIHYFKFPQKA